MEEPAKKETKQLRLPALINSKNNTLFGFLRAPCYHLENKTEPCILQMKGVTAAEWQPGQEHWDWIIRGWQHPFPNPNNSRRLWVPSPWEIRVIKGYFNSKAMIKPRVEIRDSFRLEKTFRIIINPSLPPLNHVPKCSICTSFKYTQAWSRKALEQVSESC